MRKILVILSVLLIIPLIVITYITFFNSSSSVLNEINNELSQGSEIDYKVIKQQKIVAFGDSLTAGYGVEEEDSYPSLLKEKIKYAGYAYDVVNEGISGDTTSTALRRINTILGHKPDIVLLALGANDALQNVTVEQTRNNLIKIIEKLKESNIKIILINILPPDSSNIAFPKTFTQIIPELSKRYSLPLIPSMLEGVLGNLQLNIQDRIHPNKEGYKIIVESNIWPYLEKELKK